MRLLVVGLVLVLGAAAGFALGRALPRRVPISGVAAEPVCLKPALDYVSFTADELYKKAMREKWECAFLLNEQHEEEVVFNFLAVVLHSFDTPLGSQFEAVGKKMDGTRAAIEAKLHCWTH